MPLLKMNQLGHICEEGFDQEHQMGDIIGTITGAFNKVVGTLTKTVPQTIVTTVTKTIPSIVSSPSTTTVLKIGGLLNPITAIPIIASEGVKLATGGDVDAVQMAVDAGSSIMVPKRSTDGDLVTATTGSSAAVTPTKATGTTLANIPKLAKGTETRHPMAVNRLA